VTTDRPRLKLRYLEFLEPWLNDPDISDVMVTHGGAHVWVERRGVTEHLDGVTTNPDRVFRAIEQIGRACGYDPSPAEPSLEAMLPGGARVSGMLEPVSVDGPTLTIRLFGRHYSLDELVAMGALSRDDADQLVGLVRARKKILIIGPTGCGKTSLLNALAAYIPATDRIVLIEDTSEIHLDLPHVVRWQARRPNLAADHQKPAPVIDMSVLVKAALRQNPRRLILGEVRGLEAVDLLHALRTGHPGSFCTMHADSPDEAVLTLTLWLLQAIPNLPMAAATAGVRAAFDAVVHLARVGDRRQVAAISQGLANPQADLVSVG
jgi:pilus assembly protein CpaF